MLTVRAGALNLIDAEPSFSSHPFHCLADRDPTDTDRRGRAQSVNLNGSFK